MHKRMLAFIMILLLLLTGCTSSTPEESTPTAAPAAPAESKFVISVTGTSKSADLKVLTGSDSVQFTGSYMVVGADGSSTSHSVEGTVPAEYTVTGWIVSCVFQNKGSYGFLGVYIRKNGMLIGPSTTDAAYGMVTLATP